MSRLPDIPLIIGAPVFPRAAAELLRIEPRRGLLVSDANTQAACGSQLAAALSAVGYPYQQVILEGSPRVHPDETSIARVLKALDGQERLLIAVGSGAITDIVRFVAYQTRLPFVSFPTALSVDAYTSFTAAISIGQVKYSILAKTPLAVYADLPTLAAAPHAMTASGFSDMLAKFTALADWRLAHLLLEDAYDDEVALAARQAADACAGQASGIATADPLALQALMQGLAISGRCMVAMRSSRPAAGAEHSLAHFWEMTHEVQGLPESLHGAKTGVAAVIIAQLYARLGRLARPEATRRLHSLRPVEREQECAAIRAAYGSIADQVIANRTSFLGVTGERVRSIQERLLQNWDEVLAIAQTVPSPAEIHSLLVQAGSCSAADQIHVSPEEVQRALRCAMYTRDRFTILELAYLLEFDDEGS